MKRRAFRAEVEIDASPERVWEVLVDLERYPEWNPFTIAVRSSLVEGEPVDLTVRMSRLGITIEQREHIREVRPARRLRWGMKLGAPWLISGERDQRLEPLEPGRTRYVTEDVIAGVLSPLVFLLFAGSLEEGFREMARALAAEAERRSPARSTGASAPGD